jgi:hypothetical protein
MLYDNSLKNFFQCSKFLDKKLGNEMVFGQITVRICSGTFFSDIKMDIIIYRRKNYS